MGGGSDFSGNAPTSTEGPTLKEEPSFFNLSSGFNDSPAIHNELRNISATDPNGEELSNISGISSKPVYKLVIVPSVKTRKETPTVNYIYTESVRQLALNNEEHELQRRFSKDSAQFMPMIEQTSHSIDRATLENKHRSNISNQKALAVPSFTNFKPDAEQKKPYHRRKYSDGELLQKEEPTVSHICTQSLTQLALKKEKDDHQQSIFNESAQFMPVTEQTSYSINCATFEKKCQSNISSQEAHVVPSFTNSKPDAQQKKPRPQRKYSDEQLLQFIEEERRQKIAWLFNEDFKTYTCSDCSKESTLLIEMVDHIKETHKEKFICFECNKKFPTAYCLSSHMRQHTDDGDTFRCHLCDFSTKTGNCMYIHYNKHYERYKHECKTCGKRFMSTAHFTDHNNAHTGAKPFICVVCNKAHRTSQNLRYHQIHKHTVGIEGEFNSLKCPVCHRTFQKMETKDRHVARLHTLPRETFRKRVLCDLCGKDFTDVYYLRVHKRIHAGEKPFKCEHCSKSFASKNSLLVHLRIHTGEKPYSCEYCGKFFNQRSALTTHIKLHTGEKPFTCDYCDRTFITRTSLNLHRKVCMK